MTHTQSHTQRVVITDTTYIEVVQMVDTTRHPAADAESHEQSASIARHTLKVCQWVKVTTFIWNENSNAISCGNCVTDLEFSNCKSTTTSGIIGQGSFSASLKLTRDGVWTVQRRYCQPQPLSTENLQAKIEVVSEIAIFRSNNWLWSFSPPKWNRSA